VGVGGHREKKSPALARVKGSPPPPPENPQKTGSQKKFWRNFVDERQARDLLTEIRNGFTLTDACKLPDMPEKLEVFDWLRDPKVKVGDRSFASLYHEAVQDRALTWQDEAATIHENLEMTGDARRDSMNLKLATDRANMLMKISKEALASQVKITGDSSINVTIKRYDI
jgi:hypothetical protein